MKISDLKKYLWLFLSCLCGVFLFVGGPGHDSLRSFREVWNVGHIICFALWGYGYVNWRGGVRPRVFAEVLMLAFFVGGATELIQSQIGRDASLDDLWHDVLGGFLGFLLAGYKGRRVSAGSHLVSLVAAVFICSWFLAPTLKAAIDDATAWRQFPLLAGFESPFEDLRWSGSAPRTIAQNHVSSGLHSLRVDFSTQRYSGVSLNQLPHDWRGYRQLSMQVYNPSAEEFAMHMRIDDKHHNDEYTDRFNASFAVAPGWNSLRVSLDTVEHAPKGRRFDLGQVARVGLFVGKLDQPQTVYIDDVFLISSEK